MTLDNYMSCYEGTAGITIHHNQDGYICHGITYPEIRREAWYSKYKEKYVIYFKVIEDEAIGETVLYLSM